MLKLRKGSKVPFPELLSEGYVDEAPYFTANVGADNLESLLRHFIALHKEYIFFILELPGVEEGIHTKVYFIDGCTQEKALEILDKTKKILLNDGMSAFGFGCHRTRDEIMVGKYNVVTLFTENAPVFDGFFEKHGIPRVQELTTAWDTFTTDAPGDSFCVETDGKSIYDIPDLLKDDGIYLAQQKEGN